MRSAIAHRDAGAVRSDDFHDNRQSQPSTVGSGTLSAPEAIENAGPVLNRNTGPAIEDTERSIPPDLDDHLGFRRSVRKSVLDQVPQRVLDCGGIT